MTYQSFEQWWADYDLISKNPEIVARAAYNAGIDATKRKEVNFIERLSYAECSECGFRVNEVAMYCPSCGGYVINARA